MKISRSFLSSLVGLDVGEAERRARAAGYVVETVPENCIAITSISRPDTVVLWQKSGKIQSANAGDPTQLDDGILPKNYSVDDFLNED